MSRFAKIVLVLLLAALPLRGMAAVVANLCASPHGKTMQAGHECCVEDETQAPASHDGGAEGACSHCAACTVGSTAIVDVLAILSSPAGEAAPAFLQRAPPSHVPGKLDRPPLAS